MGEYFRNLGTLAALALLLNSSDAQNNPHKRSLADEAREYTPQVMLRNLFGDKGIDIGSHNVKLKVVGLQEGVNQIKQYVESFEDWLSRTNRTVSKKTYTKNDPNYMRNLPSYGGNIESVIDHEVLIRMNNGSYPAKVARINRMDEIIPIQYRVWQEENKKRLITFNYTSVLTRAESDFRKNAKSKKGAEGLMQIMGPTWNDHNDKSYFYYAYDPEENTRTGVRYLGNIVDYYREKIIGFEKFSDRYKLKLVTAGYHAGQSRVVVAINSGKGIESLPEDTIEHVNYVDYLLYGR